MTPLCVRYSVQRYVIGPGGWVVVPVLSATYGGWRGILHQWQVAEVLPRPILFRPRVRLHLLRLGPFATPVCPLVAGVQYLQGEPHCVRLFFLELHGGA